MADGVAVVDQQVKQIELLNHRRAGGVGILDETEAEAPEVTAER
ncbi:MAG TPA: hypothetical protein VL068_03155 [Microthrixaceae bacterium]|nr:hypothetical protein [Microthrixaceae bacterium]